GLTASDLAGRAARDKPDPRVRPPPAHRGGEVGDGPPGGAPTGGRGRDRRPLVDRRWGGASTSPTGRLSMPTAPPPTPGRTSTTIRHPRRRSQPAPAIRSLRRRVRMAGSGAVLAQATDTSPRTAVGFAPSPLVRPDSMHTRPSRRFHASQGRLGL